MSRADNNTPPASVEPATETKKPAIFAIANGTRFTGAQVKILKHISDDKSNSVIAKELDISVNTVKVHMRNIMRKLDASNRTEVAFRARQILLDQE